MLNFNEIRKRKLTEMNIEVEGKRSIVLLDSCSTTSIVRESYAMNHLGKTPSDIYGPIGCIKGIGETVVYDKGRMKLKMRILGKEYEEEFVIMNEPGIPGNLLLSAAAMGRCDLVIDFGQRIIRSQGTQEEVTFSLEDSTVLVNRARLPDQSASNQTELSDRNTIPTKNSFGPLENLEEEEDSSALQNNNHFQNNQSSHKTFAPKHPPNNRDNELREIINAMKEIKRRNKQNERKRSGRLEKVAQQINNFENTGPIREKDERLSGEENECYTASNEESKSVSEVLYLGSIPKEHFRDYREEEGAHLVYRVGDHRSVPTHIDCVTPNDDYTIMFKTARRVNLEPGQCSKVRLIVHEQNWDIQDKEVILKTFRHTPE